MKGPPVVAATAEDAPAAPAPRKVSWRRRWARRLLAAALLLACLFLCRVPILRAVGGFLVVDEPAAGSRVLLFGGDRRCEIAIDLCESGSASEILLLPWHASRLERLGIRPSFAAVVCEQLQARRLPERLATVLPGDVHTDWEAAHCLRDWLERHPSAAVTALCDRFQSRRLRHVFDAVLGPENAGRVRLRALRHRWYDETDWWQSKDGLKDAFHAYLGLTHVWICGEPTEEWHDWEPEEFEKTLR